MLILAVAAWWRLAGLGEWSLDGDEVYSWFDVQRILSGADWSHGARTQPLGYLAMAGVVNLAGLSEFTLRLAPALGGLSAVAMLLLMRRDILPTGTALVAGAGAALSPWLIYLSQSARFYGVMMPLATLTILWSLPGPRRRPVGAAIAWVAAMACHPTAALLGLGVLLPALHPPIPWRGLLATAGLGLTALGALLLADDGTLFMVAQRVIGNVDPGQYDAAHFILGLGYNLGPVVGLLALVGVFVGRRAQGPEFSALVALAVVPPVALLALAMVGVSAHQRYAVVAVPAALLLAGAGLRWLAVERRSAAMALVVAALAVPAPALLAHSRDGNRHDIRGVAAWFAEHASSEDLLVADEHGTVELYLHRHEGHSTTIVAEDTDLHEQRRRDYLGNKRMCFVALKLSRMNGAYDESLMTWLNDYFEEVARIGSEPPNWARHDNRFLIFQRRERLIGGQGR
ncbi:MAG: hypothetical protein ACI9EF_000051 [Pseudohongiellaceae bacterium]